MSRVFVFKVTGILAEYGCDISTIVTLDTEALVEMANDNFPYIPAFDETKIQWDVELL